MKPSPKIIQLVSREQRKFWSLIIILARLAALVTWKGRLLRSYFKVLNLSLHPTIVLKLWWLEQEAANCLPLPGLLRRSSTSFVRVIWLESFASFSEITNVAFPSCEFWGTRYAIQSRRYTFSPFIIAKICIQRRPLSTALAWQRTPLFNGKPMWMSSLYFRIRISQITLLCSF